MTKLIDLMKSGLDTVQIAEHLGGVSKGWSEARVYNEMRKERKIPKVPEHSGDPITYHPPKGAIKFAGHDASERAWGGR